MDYEHRFEADTVPFEADSVPGQQEVVVAHVFCNVEPRADKTVLALVPAVVLEVQRIILILDQRLAVLSLQGRWWNGVREGALQFAQLRVQLN